ncbi:MAG: GyrI-like domain-containing protein [Methanobacteriota archaeon]
MAIDQIPIGRYSLISHLSLKALRLYDQKGLLVPAVKDRITGYRSYSIAQISTGVTIRTLILLGFRLEEIGKILTAKKVGDEDTIRQIISERRLRIGSEIIQLQKTAEIISHQEISLELIPMTLTEPVIKDVLPVRVMSIREKGTYEETISRLIGELCTLLGSAESGPAGLRVVGPPMTIYHDGEYKEHDADIEVAIPIIGRLSISDKRIRISTLNGGRFLSLIYKGPYMGIHEAWSKTYEYAAKKGISLGIPGKEFYLNDPAEIAESELMTEILIPVIGEPE